VKDDFLIKSPIENINPPKIEKTKKIFLLLEELKKLIDTPTKFLEIKELFIFACFTGLRYSDIAKLRWSEIENNDGKWRICFKQQKTSELTYLPLNDVAVEILLKRKDNNNDFVFPFQPSGRTIKNRLKHWCNSAGITKNITFHSARHTFAVLQLSIGTPIFTVSKLLGHQNLNTTLVYANIVDKEKEDAMDRFGKLFK
jgi:integrase